MTENLDENKRRKPRVPVKLAYVDLATAEPFVIKAKIIDISERGIGLEIDKPISEGTIILITFDLSGPLQFNEIQGIVRWCKDKTIGVEFLYLTAAQSYDLCRYIRTSTV
jgi:hypothetical protein